MKNFKIWTLALALLMAMTGCEPDEGPQFTPGDVNKIVNEWVLSTWGGADAPFKVYIDFNDDNTYEMYQLIYGDYYVKFSGMYHISGDILTGTYDDGNIWKSGYKVTLLNEGKVLALDSQEDISIRSEYDVTVIPEDVKLEASTTRAVDVEPFL